MVAAGTPARSRWMPSCTLQELPEPQSPTPTSTRSHILASSSITSGAAGFEADGLRWRTIAVKPCCAWRMAAMASNRRPALDLLLSSNPTRLPSNAVRRGAKAESVGTGSLTGQTNTNFRTFSLDITCPPLSMTSAPLDGPGERRRRDLRSPAWNHRTHRPLVSSRRHDHDVIGVLDDRDVRLLVAGLGRPRQPAAAFQIRHRAAGVLPQIMANIAL